MQKKKIHSAHRAPGKKGRGNSSARRGNSSARRALQTAVLFPQRAE
jgi:hypothetical protein